MNLDLLENINGMVQDLAEEFSVRGPQYLTPEDVVGLAVESIARLYTLPETEVRYFSDEEEIRIWRVRVEPDESAVRIRPGHYEFLVADILGWALADTDITVAVLAEDGEPVLTWHRGVRASFAPTRAQRAGA